MKINKYNNFRNISGTVLKDLRLKANMSQQDLAEKLQLLGVELTSKEISKIENDNRLVQDFELFAFANNNKYKTHLLLSFFILSNTILIPSQKPTL